MATRCTCCQRSDACLTCSSGPSARCGGIARGGFPTVASPARQTNVTSSRRSRPRERAGVVVLGTGGDAVDLAGRGPGPAPSPGSGQLVRRRALATIHHRGVSVTSTGVAAGAEAAGTALPTTARRRVCAARRDQPLVLIVTFHIRVAGCTGCSFGPPGSVRVRSGWVEGGGSGGDDRDAPWRASPRAAASRAVRWASGVPGSARPAVVVERGGGSSQQTQAVCAARRGVRGASGQWVVKAARARSWWPQQFPRRCGRVATRTATTTGSTRGWRPRVGWRAHGQSQPDSSRPPVQAQAAWAGGGAAGGPGEHGVQFGIGQHAPVSDCSAASPQRGPHLFRRGRCWEAGDRRGEAASKSGWAVSTCSMGASGGVAVPPGGRPGWRRRLVVPLASVPGGVTSQGSASPARMKRARRGVARERNARSTDR